MYTSQAYRILVSVKLHGAEKSGATGAEITEAKAAIEAAKAADPLYRKVLRDLAKAGR
jgi:hypothetical protein